MSARPITQEDIIKFLREIEIARALYFKQQSNENLIELAKKQAVVAEAYLLTGEIDEAKNFFVHSLKTVEQANCLNVTADFSARIGKAFSRIGKHSDAIGYLLKTVNALESLAQDAPENRSQLAEFYKICTNSLLKIGRNNDAIALLNKRCDLVKAGYDKAPNLVDLIGWADVLYDLGGAYEQYEAYDASIKLYEEASSLYLDAERDFKIDTRRSLANCLTSIGGIFELKGDYDNALEKYEKALEFNRRLAVKDDDEPSLKHLAASCTHTAELYETMGRLVDALALFREKADVNLRLSKLMPVIEPLETLFLTPPEDFIQRLERFESRLPWYSLLFEMDHPGHDKLYITYFAMGRLIEELAKDNNDPKLFAETLKLFEASQLILGLLAEEYPDEQKEIKLREVKSAVRRINSQLTEGEKLEN